MRFTALSFNALRQTEDLEPTLDLSLDRRMAALQRLLSVATGRRTRTDGHLLSVIIVSNTALH